MNIFTDALFLFIYLFSLFYFGIPNINNDNYLKHKLIIFINIFIFNYVIQLIKKIKNNCIVDPLELLYNSLYIGLVAIIGYTIYVDVITMSWSREYIINNFDSIANDKTKKYATISLLIVITVVLIRMIGLLFKSSYDSCIKKI